MKTLPLICVFATALPSAGFADALLMDGTKKHGGRCAPHRRLRTPCHSPEQWHGP